MINKLDYILICVFHKTGTVLFKSIVRAMVGKFSEFKNWDFFSMGHPLDPKVNNPPTPLDLSKRQQIIFSYSGNNKELFEGVSNKKYKGIVSVRNPYEIVVSGYNYHLKCKEDWAINHNYKGRNKSYQQVLRGVSVDEGIKLEIERTKENLFPKMRSFDYRNPNVMRVRLEDFSEDYDGTILRIANLLELDESLMVDVVKRFDKNANKKLNRKSNHITNKKSGYRFPDMLNKEHISMINTYAEDLFECWGYEII